MSGFVAESRWRHLGLGSALRERVGQQYTGTQRTRKAVHGECTVELAKWTLPIISLCREPYEAKVCAAGRGAESLMQSGEVRREASGSSDLPEGESRRGQEPVGEAGAIGRRVGSCPARPARYGESWIA